MLEFFRKDNDFKLFLRYLTVVHWNVCPCNDFTTISELTNIDEEDCKFIYDNYDDFIEEYKDKKELEYFL